MKKVRNAADYKLTESQVNYCRIIDILEHVMKECSKEEDVNHNYFSNERQDASEELQCA